MNDELERPCGRSFFNRKARKEREEKKLLATFAFFAVDHYLVAARQTMSNASKPVRLWMTLASSVR